MPNHTTNLIRFGGPSFEILEPIKDAIKGPDFDDGTPRHLDFNRLFPMPPILGRVVSPARLGENGRVMLSLVGNEMRSREATPEEHAEYLAAQSSGVPHRSCLGISWYEWASHHWGTKWNAYSIEEWTQGGPFEHSLAARQGWQSPEGGTPEICYVQLKFQTAWSAPVPVIAALHKLASEYGATFDHWFSDEDGGSQFDPESNERVTVYEHNIRSDVDWEWL